MHKSSTIYSRDGYKLFGACVGCPLSERQPDCRLEAIIDKKLTVTEQNIRSLSEDEISGYVNSCLNCYLKHYFGRGSSAVPV